jgi:hypothetical protein
MNIIKTFFSQIRQKFFAWRIGEGDFGYPFHSKDVMVELHIFTGLDAQLNFDLIERIAAKMPKFQGDAFRYIAYRDLNARFKMYLALAKESTVPEKCNHPCATRA